MFAEFLRERVAKLTPEESRIIELINQITQKRECPSFSKPSTRKPNIRRAKALYWAANTYYERAERDVKDNRELGAKIAEFLGENKRKARPRTNKHH